MRTKLLALGLSFIFFCSCSGRTDEVDPGSVSNNSTTVPDLQFDSLAEYLVVTDGDEYVYTGSTADFPAFKFGPFTKENSEAAFYLYVTDDGFYLKRSESTGDLYYGPFVQEQLVNAVKDELTRNGKRKADPENMANALKFYYDDNGDFPAASKGECVSKESAAGEATSQYFQLPTASGLVPAALCDDGYYYISYDNGANYLMVAQLEDDQPWDLSKFDQTQTTPGHYHKLYCNLPAPELFLEATSFEDLQLDSPLYDCSSYAEERTVFFVVSPKL